MHETACPSKKKSLPVQRIVQACIHGADNGVRELDRKVKIIPILSIDDSLQLRYDRMTSPVKKDFSTYNNFPLKKTVGKLRTLHAFSAFLLAHSLSSTLIYPHRPRTAWSPPTEKNSHFIEQICDLLRLAFQCNQPSPAALLLLVYFTWYIL